jgi:uracil-DNA glycosylase
MDIRPEESWKEVLSSEFEAPYFQDLTEFLRGAYQSATIYPPADNIFAALNLVPFEDVRVVILGQDPYHGEGQAHGLAFSVQEGVRIPPSLRNIYKEIESDIGGQLPEGGNLTHWADQGVLLLNATLTVEAGKAGSHQGQGWEQFTDAIVKTLSDEREHLVFLLWGRNAQRKGAQIDRSKHLVLEAPHPSPFSAHSGFLGCKHFSKANTYLVQHRSESIDWI